jgi:CubicO group peptidase (beta-lactamase class C family)
LVYEEGQITQDFKDTSWSVGSGLMSDETILVSNSIGRNVVSYLVGHAICEGVITNSDSTIADWPMVQNTVYANAKIIDLLNMTAGDGGILNRSKDPDDITIAGTAIRPSMVPLEAFMGSDFFKGKKPVGNRYNYNGLVTRVLLGYLIHKMGSNYRDFLTRVITTNIRNEHPVFMLKTFGLEEAGNAKITTFMTRYDYLRFAIRLLDDWNSDTCIGEYLREIYQRRVRKGVKFSGGRGRNGAASSYGGQFHFDYSGYSGRRIAGMDGFGGQSILIDLDRKKIVIAHAMQADYDWHKLVLREIGR